MGGNLVVNTLFKVMDLFLVWKKFAMNTEDLDIRIRNVILMLSEWTENGVSVDTQYRRLRDLNAGQLGDCSVRCIPEVWIVKEEALEDSEILRILDTSEQFSYYGQCFSQLGGSQTS